MRLTEEEFIGCVNTFERMITEERAVANSLGIRDWIGDYWSGEYYNFLTDMCDFTKEDFNEPHGTDLDWYCWDTDFGKSGTVVKYSVGNTTLSLNVNSPKKLYKLIITKQNSKEVNHESN